MARKQSRAKAVCQELERRRLLSVTVTFNGAGTLNLTFHAASDTATITSNSTTGNRFIVSGTGLAATTFSNVASLDLTGSTSFSSSATINNQTGDPITLSQSIAIFAVNTNFTVNQPVSVHTFSNNGSPITLNVPSITSSADQSFFSAAVTLASDVTLTSAGKVTFGSTVNGAHSLTINNTGPVSFGGAVGGVTRLTDLTVDGPGTTSIGATIATSAAQQYNSDVSLTANSTVSTSATAPKEITFLNGVDGAFSLTTNGGVQFLGPVGSTTPLASLTVNTSSARSFATEGVTTTGSQSYGANFGLGAGNGPNAFVSTAAGNITFSGAVDGNAKPFTVNTAGVTTFGGSIISVSTLVTDAPGTTRIGADNIGVSGALTFNDAVTLTASTDLTSSGGGDITLGGSVDGGFTLLTGTSGNVNITHPIGTVTPLTAFAASGFGASAPRVVHVTGGSITTTGQQEYDGPVLLGANWQVSAGSPGVTFNSSVDGAFDMSVSTVGTARLAGVVGGTTPLNSLRTSARLDGAGAVLIKTGRITTQLSQDYGNPVTLAADCMLSSASSGGTIKFEHTIDGHFALVVGTTAGAEFHATIGGGAPLASLDVRADRGILLFAGATTSGGQTYQTPLEVDVNATLASTAGGDIVFDSSLDGSAGQFPSGELSIAFGNTPDPIAAVASEVAAGFNHGPWNGQGITSSSAATNPSQRAVGYADGIDGAAPLLAPGQILLRTTVPGDVTLDATVNFNDLLVLAQHFGNANARWDNGDLNYDGTVAFADLLTLAQHFGTTLDSRAARAAKASLASSLFSAPRR